ncbi:MAG TPA: 3-oxoacyl-[acyl-carrier-protein] synthase III C-terminal domain-containing protein [Phycisphaerae bacterium]|jgi:predicted naringenin-chalcone synthase|nr:hypothetical protein [Phycisphaerae bacterium]HOB74648.1 3-oxoacyl-[acyl-carrier-protein] synthase III C-terminal domain-containing protein [Phycisphaerae bacterium]HOJ53639.1 3-oxoacyl-[acyl-carrier-protein] synthase III C-terminal domain-containing protein [Phycisphaerae bacterium]HOL26364.1 3-oxoacyl-[acyl-carrier-protein] synthase III C-terminal domain-containing protein [Phycisphaerae bacterium]HPP21127.1 3-oxoacyl-[acyl-carrier-protein] synthase III C-terminal domain-containing protein
MSEDRPACYIQRIGTAVPEQAIETAEALRLLREGCPTRRSEKLLERIIRLTGVERRHLAALAWQGGPNSLYRPSREQPRGPGMGARTAMFDQVAGALVLRALSAFPAGELAEVRTLVTASCTHASSPGLERPIFSHTPVPASVDRWNLGFMGCSAALAAVRLVRRMTGQAGPSLILACELSSLHFQYTEKIDQMTANLLFSDGAAAMLLSSRPARARVVACRSLGLPAAAEQMVWFAGDHGLELILSQELPATLAAHLPAAVETLLSESKLGFRDVDHWLVHPGGPQILDVVDKCLGLKDDALRLSREVLRTHGNMSSPTILFILDAFLKTSAAGRVMAIAFGPGLTIEMMLLEVRTER